MKKNLLFLIVIIFAGLQASGQCLTISCPSPVNTTTDPGVCGATITFAAPVVTATCTGPVVDTFQYTGAEQHFVVPAGVTSVTIQTWGAQGGANWVNNVNYGGYATGTFSVTPGETLYIYVGQQPNGITGGFNGGGNGEGAGQGGGGGTDVRQGGNALSNRIIVGGGGGGAGYWSNLHVVGGLGGGSTGTNGYRDPDYATNPGGEGGTQTGSGPTGTCVSLYNTALTGGFGYGGAPSGCGCEGYGGGGGWYGGAGSGNCRGGGGGSGYILASATNPSFSTGVTVGNGLAIISYLGPDTPVTVIQTAGLASGSVFPVGTTTNSFTVTDIFGNTDSCKFNVVVTDNEAPVITNIPADITQANTAGQCGAKVSWTEPTISDNCSYSVSSSNGSGDFFNTGTTTVTYIATDPSGNADTVSFNVTVNDNEAPVITNVPADITQANDAGQCGAIVSWFKPTISDNCSYTFNHSNSSGDFFSTGTTTVTYIATDPSGNADTISFNVTVNDNEAPVITGVPADIIQANDAGQCGADVSWIEPTISDNCSYTVSQNYNSGNFFSKGTTTVTYIATDPTGNADTISFNVTVNDTEAPVITGMPANITQANDSGVCGATVSWAHPGASDNCSYFLNSSNSSGDFFDLGTTTVTYIANDPAGNADTMSFTVTVTDTSAPVFAGVPADIVSCPGAVTFTAPTATDNCSTPNVVQTLGPNSGDVLTNGTYVVNFTATDSAGNTAVTGFSIRVRRNPVVALNLGLPQAICLVDTDYALTGGTPTGGTWSGSGVAGGNFNASSLTAGSYAITYTYTDTSGCSASATDTVNVTICAGINNLGQTTFVLYPNPTTGHFWMNTSENGLFELFDLNGQRIEQQQVRSSHQEISVGNLSPGIYTVRFTSNSAVSSAPLVIQK